MAQINNISKRLFGSLPFRDNVHFQAMGEPHTLFGVNDSA